MEYEKFIKNVGAQQGDTPFQQPISTVLNKGYSTIDVAARQNLVQVAREDPRDDLNRFSPSNDMSPKQGKNQKEDKYNGRG